MKTTYCAVYQLRSIVNLVLVSGSVAEVSLGSTCANSYTLSLIFKAFGASIVRAKSLVGGLFVFAEIFKLDDNLFQVPVEEAGGVAGQRCLLQVVGLANIIEILFWSHEKQTF